jgi:hypothetical protein
VAATATSVSGSDALTPKTNVHMTLAGASAAIAPAAIPTSVGDMPSTITRRRTPAVRAPSAVLIPISRAASAHGVREHAVDSDCGEQQRDSRKDSEQERTEAQRRQSPVDYLRHRPDNSDRLLWIDRTDRCYVGCYCRSKTATLLTVRP